MAGMSVGVELMEAEVARVLDRSDELADAIHENLQAARLDNSIRSKLAQSMSGIAWEHGVSLRSLVGAGLCTSATALMRLQFEAVLRSIWLYYAASDPWIARFTTPNAPGNTNETTRSPSVDDMLKELEKDAPQPVADMLRQLKQDHWKPMNSYVHGGIHAVVNFGVGYKPAFLLQIIRNSNGLSTMAAMVGAMLSGDPRLTGQMKTIQLAFLDCLPPLQENNQ